MPVLEPPQAGSQLAGLRIANFFEDGQRLLPGCVRGVGFAELLQKVAKSTQGLRLAVTVTGVLADGQGTPETVRGGAGLADPADKTDIREGPLAVRESSYEGGAPHHRKTAEAAPLKVPAGADRHSGAHGGRDGGLALGGGQHDRLVAVAWAGRAGQGQARWRSGRRRW